MRRMAPVLALTLLALAGCGQPERPYRPQEAPSPARTSSTTQPPDDTADEALPAGPQTVQIADGLRARIEWPADPDPLMKIMVDQYVGTRRAVAEGESIYDHNMEYEAEIQASEWIRGFVEQDQSMRGVGRVYNLRVVSVVDNKGAQVNACIDETGIRVVSAATGKAVPRQPSLVRAPYAESVIAHRGDDGVWRIRSYFNPDERCTR
ncbi:hypothetical protein [Nonomuraea jiangxiensis]|uniref:Predicted small lipoprotein YifL n=1 Tax=Nonomuraea jiangxiensis TaxID=633440 RepID=A0A1G8FFI8_9ACTN|nr:hypothetical protein [Nonomuraea jiangxiensis]SDH80904.1 Predicted small lipoprotein YifL [Nonomuraea jiangxiensis]